MDSSRGVILGCDSNQEWLLPWWFHHYSAHNRLPVAIVDFGLSASAITWCKKREIYYIPSSEKGSAWKKKPSALLASPFALGTWIDLDCEVRSCLDPLFSLLTLGVEIALARDEVPAYPGSLPGEVHYNSGVIAFRSDSPILAKWNEAALDYRGQELKDQELLSRALFLHPTPLLELSPIYNWPHTWGHNPDALIHHYFGGIGKIAILQQLGPSGLEKLYATI